MRALVEHRHAIGVDPLDDPLGREARTRTGVQGLEPPLVEPRPAQGLRPHGRGPEQRVDPAVVARREEAVEPVRLLLVLDQPHAPPVTVPSRRTPGRLDRPARRAHPSPPQRRRDARGAVGGRADGPPVRHAHARAARALADPGCPADARPSTSCSAPTRSRCSTRATRGRVSGLCGRIWTLARDYPRLSGPEAFRDWDERGTVRVLFAHWAERGRGRARRARLRGARGPGRRRRAAAPAVAVDGDRAVRAAGGRGAAGGGGAVG